MKSLTIRQPKGTSKHERNHCDYEQNSCIEKPVDLFHNLSKFDLKKAMFAALADLSNLRADSKSFRRKLELTRSALAEIHNRISLIQTALDSATVIPFPNPVAPTLSTSAPDTCVVEITPQRKQSVG